MIESRGLEDAFHSITFHFDFQSSGPLRDRDRYQVWMRIIVHLLRNGLELPRFHYGRTPLDTLFGKCGCQFDSELVGRAWLELLAGAQVDLKRYIADEKRLHPDGLLQDIMHACRRRYIFEETPDGNENISWEWVIEPDSHIHTALIEFKSICLDQDSGHYLTIAYNHWSRHW